MNTPIRSFLLGSMGLAVFAAGLAAQSTTLLSVSSGGVQSNGNSSRPSISGAGNFVAFYSDAANLVPGDTNLVEDCFVRDTVLGTTERVSVSSAGAQGNAKSSRPIITPDGRWVAFYSDATNLVAGDTNAARDVFVRDRQTGTTVRVSVSSAGIEGSPGNLGSSRPRISADGRFVAFRSDAANLVPGDLNLQRDAFLHDRDTDMDGIYDEPGAISTILVSVSSAGVQGNAASSIPVVSDDGRYVAFRSNANNLVPGDTNLHEDVFVRDVLTGTTVRVSVSSAGAQGDFGSSRPMLSSDGRYVAFYSKATTLVPGDTNQYCFIDPFGMLVCEPARDAFVRDRDSDGNGIFDEPGSSTTIRISVADDGTEGNDRSEDPDISADGRFVTYWSDASNLVPGDVNGLMDVILNDRDTDEDGIFDEPGFTSNTLVSVNTAGAQSDGPSKRPVVSDDGRFVAFRSVATNLVTGDLNPLADVFLRDVQGNGPVGTWTDLGNGLAGTTGVPVLVGMSTLIAGNPVTLTLSNALPASSTALIIGVFQLNAPFKGGVLVPGPTFVLAGFPTLGGTLPLVGTWPGGLPSGFSLYFQHWIIDPAGPSGFSASNAVQATTP